MFPEGAHAAKVTRTFLGRSSKGSGYVGIEFEADAGPITTFLYLTDAALGYTLDKLAEMGWDAQAHDGNLAELHESPTLVGFECEIVVEHELYDGKWRPKVKWINCPGGSGGRIEGMGDREAQDFAKQLRGKVFGARAGNGQASAPKPAARQPERTPAAMGARTQTPQDDGADDIPF